MIPNDFLEHLRKRSRDLCPNYPNINSDLEPWEHLWAITSSCEGTSLACDDWSEFVKHLAEKYKFDFREECILYNDQKKNQGKNRP